MGIPLFKNNARVRPQLISSIPNPDRVAGSQGQKGPGMSVCNASHTSNPVVMCVRPPLVWNMGNGNAPTKAAAKEGLSGADAVSARDVEPVHQRVQEGSLGSRAFLQEQLGILHG